MDQNSEPIVASTILEFSPALYGDEVWFWFISRTGAGTDSDGAAFYGLDWMGNAMIGARFNGGNIEYYSGGGWTTLQAYTADTDYVFEFVYNDATRQYIDLLHKWSSGSGCSRHASW